MANLRENAVRGQPVSLQIQFLDSNGDKVDADRSPKISIIDEDGDILLAPTSRNVSRLDVGLYEYLYIVPEDALGTNWSDQWTATIQKADVTINFEFTLIDPDDGISVNTGPGKIKIGDEIQIDWTEEEIIGINILLSLLKDRLRSSGYKPQRDQFGAFIKDGYGNTLTEECNVFDNLALVKFLRYALSDFNSTPFFTNFRFSDPMIYDLFSYIITEGAYLYSVSAQSLIEKGRDFQINDGGFSYQPPQLGDFLQSHYTASYSGYREQLKFIKNSIRPGPRSFGTFSTSGNSPVVRRLRSLRARRIL